jgi:hypothetical protein
MRTHHASITERARREKPIILPPTSFRGILHAYSSPLGDCFESESHLRPLIGENVAPHPKIKNASNHPEGGIAFCIQSMIRARQVVKEGEWSGLRV